MEPGITVAIIGAVGAVLAGAVPVAMGWYRNSRRSKVLAEKERRLSE